MFSAYIGNHNYRVSFQHTRPRNGVEPNRGITVCEITAGKTLVGWGVYRQDNFNRNKGRKGALALALKEAGFEKADRWRFWTTYFFTHGRID